MWRDHLIDLGHCRLRKCCDRVATASAAQLRSLSARAEGHSGCAVAISGYRIALPVRLPHGMIRSRLKERASLG